MTAIRPELQARFGNDPDALEWARTHVQTQIDWLNEAAALPQAGDGFVQLATWCANFMRGQFIGTPGERGTWGYFDERFGVKPEPLADALADAQRDSLELVDLARVKVAPGDKILIRPRPEFWPLGDDFIERLTADLERLFPGVQVVILAAPVDVAVIESNGEVQP